jgi:hypothetical protein
VNKAAVMICAAALALAGARSASAQSIGSDRKWFLEGQGGGAAVEHAGGLGGGILGRQISSRLDIFAEVVYLQDVVTRRQVESADRVAAYLAQAQGHPASVSFDSPATFAGLGLRIFLRGPSGFRPYLVGQVGAAHVALRPAFSLAGADVTAAIDQYGVTLGSDLTGSSNAASAGGGIGVIAGGGAWYLDVAVRVIGLQRSGQTPHAACLSVAVGRRF